MTPGSVRHAHLVGIGGIGMSALAQWLAASGWQVSGTDRARSDITDALTRAGISLDITETPALPRNRALLVYSDAVPPKHPLREAARARGICEVSYAGLLGERTRSMRTIAISGSHGKSTTTALVGLMLEAAGLDPTVVVGTRVPHWQQRTENDEPETVGNYRNGASELAVVEADEYRKHFLHFTPHVAAITSVDHDHIDAFPTPAEYRAAYAEFLGRLAPGGTAVLSAADPATATLARSVPQYAQTLTFALSRQADAVTVVASPPELREGKQEFRLCVRGEAWGAFALSVPGEHVVANAAAAVSAVLPFEVGPTVVRQALGEFRGTWRRFELVGALNGAPVISDYAHHPTELRALAAAARQWYPGKRLVIAFQPHQHARTRAFAEQFRTALGLFDVVLLTEVYDVAGREDQAPVTTADWVAPLRVAGREATYARTLEEVAATLRARARPEEVVLVVGAGDIDTVARRVASP